MTVSLVLTLCLQTLCGLFFVANSAESERPVLVLKQTFKTNDPTQKSLQYRELQEGFEAGIRRRNLSIPIQYVDIDDDAKLKELKDRKDEYQLIIGLGTLPAKIATENFDVTPVIYSMVLNPNRHQLDLGPDQIQNVAGGIRARLEPKDYISAIQKVHPNAKSIGLIYQSDFFKEYVEDLMKAGNAKGIKFYWGKVNTKREFAPKFKAVLNEDIDLFLMLPDTIIFERTYQQIFMQTAKQGIPCVGPSFSYVKAGALWGVVISPYDIGEQTATMLEQALQGKEVTVEYPRTSNFVFNEKTARKLNFTFPEGPFLDAKTQGNVVQ